MRARVRGWPWRGWQAVTPRAPNRLPCAVCFNIYDQDDSGGITFDEFATVMQIIAGEDFDGELHKAEHLAKAFECMDTNQDSVLSFEGAWHAAAR